MTTRTQTLATLWATLYAATIVAANIMLQTWGIIPVGFGLVAPAAVIAAGFAFVLRDLLHETIAREHGGTTAAGWCLLAIAVGSALSAFVNPGVALASALAFGASELVDLLVFVRVRASSELPVAVVASNVVGVVLDSVIFLAVAFGSLAFLPGQLLGKAYATVLFLLVWAARRVL